MQSKDNEIEFLSISPTTTPVVLGIPCAALPSVKWTPRKSADRNVDLHPEKNGFMGDFGRARDRRVTDIPAAVLPFDKVAIIAGRRLARPPIDCRAGLPAGDR